MLKWRSVTENKNDINIMLSDWNVCENTVRSYCDLNFDPQLCGTKQVNTCPGFQEQSYVSGTAPNHDSQNSFIPLFTIDQKHLQPGNSVGV